MTPRYEAVQRRIFGELARSGAYDRGGSPPPAIEEFVRASIEAALSATSRADLKALDCGCGAGTVLRALREVLDRRAPGSHRIYGFDLAPDMIAVARRQFPDLPPGRLQVGSVLDPDSYRFGDEEPRFDLVCCKGVVEQLPWRLQFRAVETMLDRVRPGGAAILFEKERYSRYGLAMGFRKFVTRHLGLPLVPRYFTAARYPPLARFGRRLARRFRPTLHAMPDGRLRALIVRVPG